MATALGGSEIPVHVPVDSSEVNPTATIPSEISYHCATPVGSFRFRTNKSLLYLPTSKKKGCGVGLK